MWKFLLIFAVLSASLYVYVTEDMESQAKKQVTDAGGFKAKLIGYWDNGVEDQSTQDSAPQPVYLETALLTIRDSHGKRLGKDDARVRVYSNDALIAEDYTDANGEIRVNDVETLTYYRAEINEGYGASRFYPVNKSFQFTYPETSLLIQRKALLQLSFTESSNSLGNTINLTSGTHLLLFKLRTEGQGVIRRPSIRLIPIEEPSVFTAWIWAYKNMGLNLPNSLETGMLKFDERYQFNTDLSDVAYGTYALQIENVTEGKFDFCVYDDMNLEAKCTSFNIGG